ncbi:hypothetical protein SAY86_027973 [Trapa natans]|uniref:RING-type domain-containing protein n=1 Tax=Trapa natans TaxID=22666 RepID=A0AAN7RAA8_TRANT|nr:hypothetical protein SAY86_027973 [Trapa natans]
MGLNIRNAAMGMAKRVAVTPLRALYNLCFFFLAVILARVGLLRVRPLGRREGETLEEPPTPNDLYVLVMDGGAPSLVHVRVLTSLFKNRVPVVEFGEYMERRREGGGGGGRALEEAVCAVCLSGMEKRDEMRDLWSCRHVFHRQCLDRWVDLGHVTCPLCRSSLLPSSFSYKAGN